MWMLSTVAYPSLLWTFQTEWPDFDAPLFLSAFCCARYPYHQLWRVLARTLLLDVFLSSRLIFMKVCNILAIGCLLDVIHLLPLPFYPVWKLIGSEAFMGCTTGSLLGFDIPADTKGMTIGNHCFMGCESLVTFSTANDSVEIFETGLDLLTEHGIKTACRNGWTYFPIHKLCYQRSFLWYT